MGVTNDPTFFIVATALIPLLAAIFVIYFLVSVMKFMKKKIKLDEQRIEQTNRKRSIMSTCLKAICHDNLGYMNLQYFENF